MSHNILYRTFSNLYRHIQDFSVSSSIHTRSFPFTLKRLWRDIRALNGMKFHHMSLPLPIQLIDLCFKVITSFIYYHYYVFTHSLAINFHCEDRRSTTKKLAKIVHTKNLFWHCGFLRKERDSWLSTHAAHYHLFTSFNHKLQNG